MATRAAIQAEPARTLCTWFNHPLSPRVETEADMLLRLPPPHVHPPFLCQKDKESKLDNLWCGVRVFKNLKMLVQTTSTRSNKLANGYSLVSIYQSVGKD